MEILSLNFLEMGGDDAPPIYDAVWCAGLAGVAAREANVSVRECLYDMSMFAVCAYFVSWRRRESADGVKIRGARTPRSSGNSKPVWKR